MFIWKILMMKVSTKNHIFYSKNLRFFWLLLRKKKNGLFHEFLNFTLSTSTSIADLIGDDDDDEDDEDEEDGEGAWDNGDIGESARCKVVITEDLCL